MYSYFLYFAITALAIHLTPGPAMMYCINSSITHGKRAGIAAAIGIELGTFIYVVTTGLGLSALILSSPLLYSGLKTLGALYLLYLAYRAFPRKNIIVNYKSLGSKNSKFCGGLILNLTNPKMLLFFCTLLPQFIPATHRTIGIFFLLGLSFNFSGLIVNVLAAIFGYDLKRYLINSPRIIRVFRYMPSTIFFLVAAFSLLSV